MISQEQNKKSCWNFHSIFAMIGNRTANLVSTITQPWRHLGAILWFDVIIHIFITIHPKSAIFNAHKLQAICQHTGLSVSGLYQIRARQNLEMLKITYKQFWVRTRSFRAFLNFPSVRVRAQRAKMAEIQNFYMIWIPNTTIDNFHSFAVTLDLL